jgi:hypothetical protein
LGRKLTPVQLAKELDIRPQLIYTLIKHEKVRTYTGVRAATVDEDEVKTYLSKSQERREERAIRPPRESGASSFAGLQAAYWSRPLTPIKPGDLVLIGEMDANVSVSERERFEQKEVTVVKLVGKKDVIVSLPDDRQAIILRRFIDRVLRPAGSEPTAARMPIPTPIVEPPLLISGSAEITKRVKIKRPGRYEVVCIGNNIDVKYVGPIPEAE